MSRFHPMSPEERKARRQEQGRAANAIVTHVHPDVSIRQIRESIVTADEITDPVRGLNRGYFNMGEGCRRVGSKPRSA